MSIDELASTTPVKPPMVNNDTKPMDHKNGVSNIMCDPDMVAIHLKIFTPVGMAIIIVAAVK